MSFGGSVGAMISSLKMNARPRKKAFETYKQLLVQYPPKRKEGIVQPLSKEEKYQIKRKIQAQLRKERRVQYISLAVAISVILAIILAVNMFYHFFSPTRY